MAIYTKKTTSVYLLMHRNKAVSTLQTVALLKRALTYRQDSPIDLLKTFDVNH